MFRTFWYDGHRCETKCVRRGLYGATINGEEFDRGSNQKHLADEMIAECKYRAERDPDIVNICGAVLAYCDEHVPGRNNENEWVILDAIKSDVLPNERGTAIRACYLLEDMDHLELTKARSSPNNTLLIRPTVEEIPDPDGFRVDVEEMMDERFGPT
jgi:hypothetical protein